jgi:hypothetical protein
MGVGAIDQTIYPSVLGMTKCSIATRPTGMAHVHAYTCIILIELMYIVFVTFDWTRALPPVRF